MNDRKHRLTKMTRQLVYVAVLCGGFTACHDRFDLDEPGHVPSWLGQSVYAELQNPNPENLTGTFKNFLRLIDDLGYTEVLSKTGSKTLFPANDEAFDRFYKSNQWGVNRYEDLSETQKKLLLFSAMLDNAILIEMLSNVSDNTYSSGVNPGVALKHTTGVTVIDSITHVPGRDQLPQNNTYWDKFEGRDMHMVMDNTRPMMVHFTAEQMIRNNVSTEGENSDFEVVTGMPYNEEEKSAYIFRNRIVHGDVTCKNGYIHQLENVLVPPGNIAELLRTNGESFYFSRMLDRFSAPYYDAASTRNYNDAALMTGGELIDSVFQKRYFSQRSQNGAVLRYDPDGNNVQYLLDYDPGWNTYTSGEGDALSDLAAIFVPTDDAMKQYFLEGGSGAFLIDQYGKLPNTVENLAQNIDSIPISIVHAFVRNLMKSSFLRTVPSKFGNVMDDASDPMGLTTDDINRNPDGTYDVKIANNGVAYMLNKVYAPNRYVAVSAPALLSDNMKVFNVAINDGDNGSSPLSLNLNFYAYLLAMGANYAFFIPTDAAFKNFYVDPTRLQNVQPRALKFYPIAESPYVGCSAWEYDPVNNLVLDSIGTLRPAQFKSQLIDILNFHTIVLGDGEIMGQNKYYKSKHGGEVMFEGTQVRSGAQIDGQLAPSVFDRVYNQKNGTTYAIDHIIQAPQKSVYSVLSDSLNPQFTDFMELCSGLSADSLMEFASDRMMDINTVTRRRRMDGYLTFIAKNGLTDNVNYFNSFNYTVWAPDNEAMAKAFAKGLPHWSDISAIYDQWAEYTEDGLVKWSTLLSDEDMTLSPYQKGLLQADRDKVLAMIEEINTFIRYHFQDNSVYADNIVEANEYSTASADTLGVRKKLHVNGGNGILNVIDNGGNTITVNANSTDKVVNQMTRDYVFNTLARVASEISTSSFAVIHQVSTPFNSHSDNGRYDSMWTGSGARQRLASFRKLYDSVLYKRY